LKKTTKSIQLLAPDSSGIDDRKFLR